MPAAAASLSTLADPPTSPSRASGASSAKTSSAARSWSAGAASPDASLPRFQDALDDASRPPDSPPAPDAAPAPSPDPTPAQGSDDSSPPAAEDRSLQGPSAADRPAEETQARNAKPGRHIGDATHLQMSAPQTGGNPDGVNGATAPPSEDKAPASPEDLPTGPRQHHHAGEAASDPQPAPGPSPNPVPVVSADLTVASAQAAAAQNPPAQPSATPAAPITPATSPVTAAPATPPVLPAGAVATQGDPAPAAGATVKKLPGGQKPESSTVEKSEAEKPAANTRPQSDPTPTVSDQHVSTLSDQQNSPINAAESPPLQLVGKPSAKADPGKADSGTQKQTAPAPMAAQQPGAATTATTGAPVDAGAASLQPDAATDRDPPKPAPTSAAVTASPLGHGAITGAPANQGADAAAAAQQMPAPQRDETFDQIVMGLRGKLDAQNGKAEISLNPPNLGLLHVSISLDRGALTAQFQSSSDLVRDLLRTHMEKLKSVLEGQGIAVDHLAVEAPADKVVPPAVKMPPSNAPQNDGRSAGQYTRDQHSGQKRPQTGNFTLASRAAATKTAVADAPFDVVA